MDISTATIKQIQDVDVTILDRNANENIEQPGYQYLYNIDVPEEVIDEVHNIHSSGKTFLRPVVRNNYNNKNIQSAYTTEQGFTPENTQVYRYDFEKNTDVASKWFQHFAKDILKIKNTRILLNWQPPGSWFPKHLDYMDTWAKENTELATSIRYPDFQRHIMFLSDQETGHFYGINKTCLSWKIGDVVRQEFNAWHATGNGGTMPKITIVFEGVYQ